MNYFDLSQQYRNPNPEQRRELFEMWWISKQPYRDAVIAGGGPVRDKEEAFKLFCRRWKRPDSSERLATKPLGNTNAEAVADRLSGC